MNLLVKQRGNIDDDMCIHIFVVSERCGEGCANLSQVPIPASMRRYRQLKPEPNCFCVFLSLSVSLALSLSLSVSLLLFR